MEETTIKCACGKPLHYTSQFARSYVEHVIADLGPLVPVSVGQRRWLVPRHFIALHGLGARKLPALAKKYGFKEITHEQ